MAAARSPCRISPSGWVNRFPRAIVPSLSRQQGVTVPSHSTASCLVNPWQKSAPLSGADKSGVYAIEMNLLQES